MKAIEEVRFYRDPELPGLETCRVARSHHVFPNHNHEGIYAIGLMEAGGSYCLGPDHGDAFVAPGQVALLNPAQVHSGVPPKETSMTYRMLYVEESLMRETAGEIGEKTRAIPEFRQMVVCDPALFSMMERLCRLIAVHADLLEKESAVLEGLWRLVSGHCGLRRAGLPDGTGHRAIRRAKELLSENLNEKVSLEEAARAAGLSRYHFLRAFKKEVGVPPHVYRTQKRIDLARQLLKAGMPLVEAAMETGFTDQSHFTNKFRQFTGATPGQYLPDTILSP